MPDVRWKAGMLRASWFFDVPCKLSVVEDVPESDACSDSLDSYETSSPENDDRES